MKIFKSHFWYDKSQRNGVLFLILSIVVLQAVYIFVDFYPDKIEDINSSKFLAFEKQIDSLRVVEIENKKPKIYPFNPNYITDFKGYQLGMSLVEIDRLHKFRKQKKFVNSINEFKSVTKVSDTLLNKIAPYFKFPAWVVKRQKEKYTKSSNEQEKFNDFKFSKKKTISTNAINLATAEDFTIINGIGEKLSQRIINYRTKLQGFSYSYQLYEVWGVDSRLIQELLSVFEIKNVPVVNKININTASFKEVLKTPYVDYNLCKKIFDYRDEVAELQNISELRNIQGFPEDKYERIVLYLDVN